MPEYYGDFAEDATVYIPFNTFSSDDPAASVTITNLADADIMVHKDGSVTQIATDGATVAIDFDSITGNHLITIDTSVHADYATGSDYLVRIEGTTVDGATINAWVGSFSIENRFMRGTNSAATASALSTAQADLDTITGSDGVTLATAQANYAPATAAALTTVDTNVDAILVDTGTTIPATLAGLNDPTSATIATAVWSLSSGLAGTAGDGTIAGVVLSTEADTNELQTDDVPGLIAALDVVVDRVEADTQDIQTQIGTAGAGLTDLGGMSTAMKAEVNAEADTALSDIHLDHLFATAYDATAKPGAADALLNEIVEDDAGVTRYTTNALENGPGGGGNVTVGTMTQAALAQFLTDDTGETVASAGSVGKIAQGQAGGNVTVGTMTTAALAQFATDDTGETTAVSGSVAELSQGSGGNSIYEYTDTVEEGGSPIDGATVTLVQTGGTDPIDRTSSNALGSFTVRTDVAGGYDLLIQHSGYASKRVAITIS